MLAMAHVRAAFQLIQRLPQRVQQVVMMRANGISADIIGKHLGMSANAVRVAQHRGLVRLRQLVEESEEHRARPEAGNGSRLLTPLFVRPSRDRALEALPSSSLVRPAQDVLAPLAAGRARSVGKQGRAIHDARADICAALARAGSGRAPKKVGGGRYLLQVIRHVICPTPNHGMINSDYRQKPATLPCSSIAR